MNDHEFTIPFPGSASTGDTHEFPHAHETHHPFKVIGYYMEALPKSASFFPMQTTVRCDVTSEQSEIDMLRQALGTAGERINAQDVKLHAARNLLAVMHRDGGHHEGAVGFVQACKDAEEVRHKLYQDLDAKDAEIERLKKALKEKEKQG